MKLAKSKIINNTSPFSRFSYDKESPIENFVGRQRELVLLSTKTYDIVERGNSLALKIAGPGGSGKSTLFGYYAQMIRTGDLFKQSYCNLDPRDVDLQVAFIDAPKGEKMTTSYFWRSTLQYWAGGGNSFEELFAAIFVLKSISVLWDKTTGDPHKSLKELMAAIIPDLEYTLSKGHSIDEVINYIDMPVEFLDKIYDDASLFTDVKDIILSNLRQLQRHRVAVKTRGQVSLNINTEFIENLLTTLDMDMKKATSAQENLRAEGDLISSESELITLINWILNTWEWITGKRVCFVIGIDNIGYLMDEIKDKGESYNSFIQTMLQLRNSLRGFLFVLIGTNDDWSSFDSYVNGFEDYCTQLSAFLTNTIDLLGLDEKETKQALTFLISRFWTITCKFLPKNNPCYPFSPDFFSYLYNLKMKNYREILLTLDNIWRYFKTATEVEDLTEPFNMIRFVRLKLERVVPRNLAFSLLTTWEKENILHRFEKLDSAFRANAQSKLVEKTLGRFLEILSEEQEPREIRLPGTDKRITFTKRDGSRCSRIPDVYAQLFDDDPYANKRSFEMQVKIYGPKKEVHLAEIESDLDLLEYGKIDAVLFVMTGAGLEKKALDEIQARNLQDRIRNPQPLNKKGKQVLAFCTQYKDLTGADPSVENVCDLFSLLFNTRWDSILEMIRNTGAFTQQQPQAIPSPALPKPEPIDLGSRSGTPSLESPAPTQQPISPPVQESQIPSAGPQLERSSTEVSSNVSGVLPDLNDELHNKNKTIIREIYFILDEALKRTKSWHGRVTSAYVKKRVSDPLKDEDVYSAFKKLEKDAEKGGDKVLFTKIKTTLYITKTGEDFFKFLESKKEDFI
ncbi:MAG: hypothetical protein ACFFCS_20320 [Candidatus Hodarchaeota archaeon]